MAGNMIHFRILLTVVVLSAAVGCSFKNGEDAKPAMQSADPKAISLSKVEQIFAALYDANPSILRKALEGATFEEVNATNAADETPLELAIEANRITAIDDLLNAGAIPLHHTSKSTNANPQTLLDFAREKVGLGANKRILNSLSDKASEQKRIFDALLADLDFSAAWNTAKKFNLVSINADLEILNSVVSKSQKVEVLSSADRGLLNVITESINSREAWDQERIAALFRASILTNDIAFLNQIEKLDISVDFDLSQVFTEGKAIKVATLEKSLEILKERNINTSVKMISKSLEKRLATILEAKDYSAWDEFSWIVKNIDLPSAESSNLVIRDNYLNYVITYYYQYAKPMDMSFSIDTIGRHIEVANRLSNDLSISFDTMELVLNKSGRHSSISKEVSELISRKITSFSKESWKKVFTTKNLRENSFYLENFSFSALTLEEGVELLENILIKDNLLSSFGEVFGDHLSETQFSEVDLLKNLLRSLSRFENREALSKEIYWSLLNAGFRKNIKIDRQSLEELRARTFTLVNKEGVNTELFCKINNLDKSGKPSDIVFTENGSQLKLSISQFLKFPLINGILKEKLSTCVLPSNDNIILRYQSYAYSTDQILVYRMFNSQALINPIVNKYANIILPNLSTYDMQDYAKDGLDVEATSKVLDSVLSKNSLNDLIAFLTNLNTFSTPNHSLKPEATLLNKINSTIETKKVTSIFLSDNRVLLHLIRYIQISNLRFAVSMNSALTFNYFKFIENPTFNTDPIEVLKQSILSNKIIYDLAQQDINIDLSKLPSDLSNLLIPGQTKITDVLVPGSQKFLGLERSPIDKDTFNILRSLNKVLNGVNSWNEIMSSLDPNIQKIIINEAESIISNKIIKDKFKTDQVKY